MKKTNLVLILTVVLMDLLAGMEFDLFVPSFPELHSQFHLSAFSTEALLSINFIGYCFSLFFVGGLADRYGRKPIILLGIIIFIIGTLLCLWAHAYYFLLVGRLFQGIGIASPAILSFLIIADAYPLKQQQFYMAILNGMMNVGAGIAPVIGSYITLYFHWQGNFIFLLGQGVIVMLLTGFVVPHSAPTTHHESIGYRSYIPIFKSKPMMLLITNFVAVCVPYWIFVGISPLLYMKDLGVSLAHFGYYQGIFAFIFGLGSMVFGFFLERFEQKSMLNLANAILIVGLLAISWVTFFDSKNPLHITLAFLPFVMSQIIPSVILYPLCLNYMPESKGRVSAIIQAGRLLLTAFSLQLAGYTYQGTFFNIGLIICCFILFVVISLHKVIHHPDLSL